MRLKLGNSKTMEIKIIHEKRNDLFKRKEIKLNIKSEISPSNADVEKWIAENYKVEIDAIKIKNILGRFGSQNFSVVANVYDSFEDKDKTEVKTKRQREAEKKALEEKFKAKKESEKVKESEEEEKEATKTKQENKAPENENNSSDNKPLSEDSGKTESKPTNTEPTGEAK